MTEALEQLAWPEDVEIPQKVLDAPFDSHVPPEYMDELMASEGIQHLRNYHTAVAALRSARHVGDPARIEPLAKMVAHSRNCIALIHYKHPLVKAAASKIMALEAKRAQEARDNALEGRVPERE